MAQVVDARTRAHHDTTEGDDPQARSVTGSPREVTLQDVNTRTRQYATAMAQVAQEMAVGFVLLFDTMLSVESRLAGEASLYADEVHLNARGDLLYSQLVYQYLDLQ